MSEPLTETELAQSEAWADGNTCPYPLGRYLETISDFRARAERAELLITHLGSWRDRAGACHDLTNPEAQVQSIIDAYDDLLAQLAEAQARIERLDLESGLYRRALIARSAELEQARARLSEFSIPMKCGHPRAALDVVERACAVCQQQACIAALERVVDAARAAKRMIIGGALRVRLDNALAALDKPARRWAYDDPVTGQTCYSDTPLTCAGAYEVPVDSPADPRREALERVGAAVIPWYEDLRRHGGVYNREAYPLVGKLYDSADALAALDKPVREEEPVMPGVNTEVPDVADD